MLRLATLRSHDQYNTTIYSLDDRYRGVFGRRDVLFMNERELARRGLAEGDLVDVLTALVHARSDRIVQSLTAVRYSLPDGCCAAYYPETQALIALEAVDPDCLTPSYKSIPVTIVRAALPQASALALTREGIAGQTSSVGATE